MLIDKLRIYKFFFCMKYLFWFVMLDPIPNRDMVSPYKLGQTFGCLKDTPEKYSTMRRKCT